MHTLSPLFALAPSQCAATNTQCFLSPLSFLFASTDLDEVTLVSLLRSELDVLDNASINTLPLFPIEHSLPFSLPASSVTTWLYCHTGTSPS